MKPIQKVFDDVPPGWMNFIILSIGFIATLIGAIIDSSHDIWKQAMLGVGGSVIASAIVAFLTSHYLRSQNTSLQLMETWRLVDLFRTRADANQLANQLLPTTKQLDIVAFGLRGFRDRHSDRLESLVKSGTRIRILTLDPNSQFVTARTKSENLKEGQLKKEITDLIRWVSVLRSSSSNPDLVDIRLYDTVNLDFYFRMDDIILVGPYLHEESSQQTITYAFKRGGIGFEYWEKYFKRLWQKNNFCKSAFQDPNDDLQ